MHYPPEAGLLEVSPGEGRESGHREMVQLSSSAKGREKGKNCEQCLKPRRVWNATFLPFEPEQTSSGRVVKHTGREFIPAFLETAKERVT